MSARRARVIWRSIRWAAGWTVVYVSIVASIVALVVIGLHFAGVIAWPSP